MFNLSQLLKNKNTLDNNTLAKDKIAELLSTDLETLNKFEKAYQRASSALEEASGYVNAKSMANLKMSNNIITKSQKEIIDKIVSELLNDTTVFKYCRNNGINKIARYDISTSVYNYTTLNDLEVFKDKPQLTGNYMTVDIPNNYKILITDLYKMQEAAKQKNTKLAKRYYNMFRQGLDFLDLDPIMYEILNKNISSMGYWLPEMIKAIEKDGFFLIPSTTIVKVPLPILQLTRLDYTSLNRNTLDIVDLWAQKAFDLDTTRHYFIKTGIFSSKFDFRNAKITEPKEVLDIGEYLLFIHNQSVNMAAPDLSGKNRPAIYGAATTNEWVVREFIEDEDNEKFAIYNGLPLHTEYRVFVDFDTDEVLGIHPYWDPTVMKHRFGHAQDLDNPNMIHDYITYTAQEPKLMTRYNENKELVKNKVQAFIPNVELSGQWSIDIMQNGDKFWFIDMATAETSAFYNKCVPKNKRMPQSENWLPELKV